MGKTLFLIALFAFAACGVIYFVNDIFDREDPVDFVSQRYAPHNFTHENIKEAIFCVHIYNAADPNRAQRVGEMCDQIISKI